MGCVRDVCVLGLGLIGGSLLRAASKAGRRAWAATHSPADVAAARDEGFDVCGSVGEALARARAADALAVLAVPLGAVQPVLRTLADAAPEVRLTDVTSVKQPVAEAVARLAPRARYAGGHPMAGSTASGWGAGAADLFERARWVVCIPEDVPADPVAWDVVDLALDCGAAVVPARPAAHDAAVARISHLPHLLAAVLAAVGADGGPLAVSLAAGSFTDGTRVAGTDPDLTLAMCEGNAAALLPALDEALDGLGAARAALASAGSLRPTVATGWHGRGSLDARVAARHAELCIELDSPGAPAALLGVGERGGAVLAREGNVLVATVPVEP
jgi:prephenate dehydrogenase